MKQIVLTDYTTNLARGLIEEKNICVIPTDKSPTGQILFALDQAASYGFQIIYLSSDKNFSSVLALAQQIAEMHTHIQLNVINIDSADIGKNNLVLRLLNSDSLSDTLQKYHASATYFYMDDFAVDYKFNKMII